MPTRTIAVIYAVLAAACYGISVPLSKFFLAVLSPTFMAALLYLGAGLGMLVVKVVARGERQEQKEAQITRKELPFVLGMIGLDIAAPILLMLGLALTSPATVSLLNNFEIVATAIIALLFFKEAIGRRLWLAIFFITLSSIILSVEEGYASFSLSVGAVFALLACVCWGFENNCTRMLSLKDPVQIVIIKGLGSGLGALLIAASLGAVKFNALYVVCAMLLGFFAYGLSIYFYILAQRELGAARTSAYYAVAPFIGVGLSLVMFSQGVPVSFWIALPLMVLGTYFAVFEKHEHLHQHEYLEHEHRHSHSDGHHDHIHEPPFNGEHSHAHVHEDVEHSHAHTPDLHHTHRHK